MDKIQVKLDFEVSDFIVPALCPIIMGQQCFCEYHTT
jgi:hypothetical protein